MKSTVSIKKVEKIEDIGHLKGKLSELLKPLGGPEKFLTEGQDILLKPNLVSDKDYRTGSTTNPYLMVALIELLLPLNPAKIFIADGSAVGKDTQQVIKRLDYPNVFSDYLEKGILEIRDFKEGPFEEKKIPGGEELESLEVPRLLEDADRIINLPVTKTHNALPVTLGLKNMKGIIKEGKKKEFHRRDLRQCILDLNKVVSPDFTVYDGTVGMEGLGPTHGEPVNWKLLLATEDPVAGDLVSALGMGFRKQELNLIKMAENQGLGWASLENIRIIGEQIEDIKKPFERYSLDEDFYRELGLTVHDGGSCSGCRHVLDGLGEKLKEKAGPALRGKDIYVGPQKIKGNEENVIIGNCLKGEKEKGAFIPGCPPHEDDIRKKL